MSALPTDSLFKVKTVVALTGIPRNTLVAWERRYNLFSVRRTENGYRLYSQEDVDLLRRLRGLVDEGLTISEAVRLAGHEGALGDTPRRTLWEDLLDPLLRYDRAGAEPFLRRVELLPWERAIEDVYRPLLRELGCRWADGSVSIAQEHYASSYIREALLTAFRVLDAGPVGGPAVACASMPGEVHDIGLLMVAIRLALRGWRVTWLGADVPIDDLCTFVEHNPPRLLCLSALRTEGQDRLLENTLRVRAAAPDQTLVVVGGPGAGPLRAASTPKLWFSVDEDMFLAKLGALQPGAAWS